MTAGGRAAGHGVSLHPPGEGNGGKTENKEEAAHSNNMSERSKGREVVETSKMTERSGNVYENKGAGFGSLERSANVIENRHSYTQNAEMLLKTKGFKAHDKKTRTMKWGNLSLSPAMTGTGHAHCSHDTPHLEPVTSASTELLRRGTQPAAAGQ
jgi:hypothetical protein